MQVLINEQWTLVIEEVVEFKQETRVLCNLEIATRVHMSSP